MKKKHYLKMSGIIIVMKTLGFVMLVSSSCVDNVIKSYCECYNINGTVQAVQCIADRRHTAMTDLIIKLPETLTNLTYITDELPPDDLMLGRFPRLRKLEILWSGDITLIANARVGSVTNNLGNLRNLVDLKINLPLANIEPTSLLGMASLQHISFDNAGYLTSENFAAIHIESKLHEKPLKSISLRRFSNQHTGRVDAFKLRDILPLLKGSNITSVDFSYNKYMFVIPGLLLYVPNVHTLRIAGNVLLFSNESREVSCAIIDMVLLKHLTILDISDMGTFGVEYDIFGRQFLQNVPTRGCFRDDFNCMCETYKQVCSPFTDGLNCNHAVHYDLKQIVDFTCFAGFKIPLQPSLEYVYTSNTNFGFYTTGQQNQDFSGHKDCWLPNNVRYMDASRVPFGVAAGGNKTLTGFENLGVLIARDSGWGSFFYNKAFLHTLPSLEVLDLSGTVVGTYIATDTSNVVFSRSKYLKELYLRNAKITTIPDNEFLVLQELTILDLSANQLLKVTFSIKLLPTLSFLNLSSSGLRDLPKHAMEDLDMISTERNNIVRIELTKNSLSCLCDNIHFVKWIFSTNIHIVARSDYLCTHPTLGVVSMKNVNITSLVMHCNQTAVIISCILGLLILIALIVLLLRKYRKPIGYWWLRMKHRSDVDGDNYLREAFVIYTDEDRFWVHGPLLTKIEKEMKMKICIHHRDFVPGYDIDEQIINAVSSSRKTIVVLSPSFLESEWCNYELQLARNRLQTEGIDILVPIILTDFPQDRISPTLRQILSEKTYLRWEANDEYFWKKLSLALRRKGKLTRKAMVTNVQETVEPVTAPSEEYRLRSLNQSGTSI